MGRDLRVPTCWEGETSSPGCDKGLAEGQELEHRRCASHYGPVHRDIPGEEPGSEPLRTRLSPSYRHALPPPRGRGRSAAGAGGVGGAGTALRETGEGGKPPSPSAPPPDVIATTVQCPGERSEEEPAPGTAFPQLSPRTAPAPGAGEEAEGRAGWGVAAEGEPQMRYPPQFTVSEGFRGNCFHPFCLSNIV